MAGQDRDGGAFFFNNRKNSQNAPDYRGELRVSQEVVQSLIAQIQSGVQFPAIEISGWKKTSGNGTVFISLSGRKPYEKNGGGNSGGGGQRSGGGAQFPSQGNQGAGQGGWPGGFGGQAQNPNGQAFGGGFGRDMDDEIPF